ncbi:MAG: hypothetical protein ABSE57_28315 [Bryobacteraceae bacterium]
MARENEQDGHERTSKFQPGCGGVCGATMEVSDPEDRYRRENEPDRVSVAAESLDQALQYMRRTHGDFKHRQS